MSVTRLTSSFALLALLASLVLVYPAAAAPGDEVFVYKMRNRVAEEMIEPVSALLSQTGRVKADSRTNSLVIVDRPENVAQIKRLLEVQDVRQKNIQITVETVTRRDLDAMHLKIDWAVRSGGWQVGTIPVPLAKSGFAALATPGAERAHSTRRAVQTVTVMNDGRAEITTGRAIPFTDSFYSYVAGHGYVSSSTRWLSVDTGFIVHARTIGTDRILLEVTPRMRNLAADGTSIDLSEASTQIEVKDGGGVVLGSSSRERSAIVGEILRGGSREREGEQTYLLVTARTR
jgi:type II secretory pathway component GspD/PulD (secretin)